MLDAITEHIKDKGTNIPQTQKHAKTVRPSTRGNQNLEAARCYKSRKNAVRTSSRGNQNFEAARCYKSRKNAVRASSRGNQNFEASRFYKTRKDKTIKAPTALTEDLTSVRTNPPKYKFHKVRIPTKHKGHKVRTTTYKGHKVQMPYTRKYKIPKTSGYGHVSYKTRNPPESKDPTPKAICCKEIQKNRLLPHRTKHTPYGPHNIPHMVLCTKQGPDNA